MARFIRQEAEETANEISVSAEEGFKLASLLRLKEPAVLLRCRKDDLHRLEHVLDSVKEEYSEKASVHAPEVIVDPSVHLPPGPQEHHLFVFIISTLSSARNYERYTKIKLLPDEMVCRDDLR